MRALRRYLLLLACAGAPAAGQEDASAAALEALLAAPSERIDLFAGALLLGAQTGRAAALPQDYLLRLAKSAGQAIAAGDASPAACLAAAADTVFRSEGFRAATEDAPVESLVLAQVVTQKRGPPVAIAVLVLAALRDAPSPAQVLCADGRYFVRVGSAAQERLLDVAQGRVAAALDPAFGGARLDGAAPLTTRQILGHYALCLGRAAERERRDALADRMLKIAWHLAPQQPELYVLEGRRALARWELAKAERCFARALKLDPAQRDGQTGAAEIYVRQRRLAEAAAALEKVFADNRDELGALRVRGELFIAKGDYRAAQDLLERLAKWKPQEARVWSDLVLAHIGRNNKVGARAALAQAEALEPDSAETQYAAGEAYANEQDLDRAFAAFQKAIAANARFAPAYLRRGAVYEAWNVPGTALRDYRACLDLLELPRDHPLARDIAARIEKLRGELTPDGR
jgi:tetratricopeptide (TPR) repeat protein